MPDSVRNVRLAIRLAEVGKPNYLIAADARMPASVLGGCVSGRHNPSPSQRQRLADVLGVPVESIFSDEATS